MKQPALNGVARPPSLVSVWHATTTEVLDDSRRARALAWLSPADRQRHDRYRFQPDRDMFLLGRTMARALVGRALGVDPCAWAWREGPRGRPEIADGAGGHVSFNIAHSAGLVVCALSAEGAVGVDVEHRRRPPVDARMVRRYCAPGEVEDIERQGPADWQDQFLKYWTLKEAYLKARGLGIAVPLSDLCFTLGADIRFERLNALSDDDAEWAFVLETSGPAHYLAAAVATSPGVRPTFTIAAFPHDLLP